MVIDPMIRKQLVREKSMSSIRKFSRNISSATLVVPSHVKLPVASSSSMKIVPVDFQTFD
jgi:hypothetical protein